MKDITARGFIALACLATIGFAGYRHTGDPWIGGGLAAALYLLAEYRR